MPDQNNWNVSYSTISFFEGALNGHSKVQSVHRDRDIFFHITLHTGQVLKILLVNEYALGLAAIFRAKAEFPDLEYIVTGSIWNGYTREAKEYGINNSIGIFNGKEILGALNSRNPIKYAKKDHEGNPQYAFKSE